MNLLGIYILCGLLRTIQTLSTKDWARLSFWKYTKKNI